jgi:hypothetical protein
MQNRPGRLDLNPIWQLTFDAAKSRNMRSVSCSCESEYPASGWLPDFVRGKFLWST